MRDAQLSSLEDYTAERMTGSKFSSDEVTSKRGDKGNSGSSVPAEWEPSHLYRFATKLSPACLDFMRP